MANSGSRARYDRAAAAGAPRFGRPRRLAGRHGADAAACLEGRRPRFRPRGRGREPRRAKRGRLLARATVAERRRTRACARSSTRALDDLRASARLRTALLRPPRQTTPADSAWRRLEAGARTDLSRGPPARTALQWASPRIGTPASSALLERTRSRRWCAPLPRRRRRRGGRPPPASPCCCEARAHRRPRARGRRVSGRAHRARADDVRPRGATPARPLARGDRRARGAWKRRRASPRSLVTDARGGGRAAVAAPSAPPTGARRRGSARARAALAARSRLRGAAEPAAGGLEAVCDGDTAAARALAAAWRPVAAAAPRRRRSVPDHAADDRGARRP